MSDSIYNIDAFNPSQEIRSNILRDYVSDYIQVIPTARFGDFDLNFERHPISGDIMILHDEQAIKQSIRNLVMLNFYEKPFRPDMGVNLRNSLFENFGNDSEYLRLRSVITHLITLYEPRVELQAVDMYEYFDDNGIKITITFKIINTLETHAIDMFLDIVR